MTVWTIGHSTRTAEEFVAVLAAHEIEAVVDVRRFPGSRRLPQFGSTLLSTSLRAAGVSYRWIEALGGRRRPDPASPNDAWENEAFRGYADYTASEEFAEGLFDLLMIAPGLRTSVMCAELLWWRCHRRILADGVEIVRVDSVRTDVKQVSARRPTQSCTHVLGHGQIFHQGADVLPAVRSERRHEHQRIISLKAIRQPRGRLGVT